VITDSNSNQPTSALNTASPKVESALLALAIRLRQFRQSSAESCRTLILPAGPGYDSSQTVAAMAAALRQLLEEPILTLHCDSFAGAQTPTVEKTPAAKPQLSEIFVNGPSNHSDPGSSLMTLPQSGALPPLAHVRFAENASLATTLASPAFESFYSFASKNCRHILIASRCFQQQPEVAMLAHAATHVVLTVAADHTRIQDIRATQAALAPYKAEMLGFLLEKHKIAKGQRT
jgi:hypothetical protein